MAIWLVRAGSHGRFETKFLEENRIYLTWHNLNTDLSGVKSYEATKTLLHKTYPDDSPARVRNFSGQIWSFTNRISVGDWIVLPSKSKPAIHIAEVKSGYQFVPGAEDPYYHFREVDWFAQDIPRSNFDQDLLYSFGAFMTICQIKRNNAESRIRAMAANNWKSSDAHRVVEPTDDEIEESSELDLAQAARDQIAKLIATKFRGHGLTRLVDEVLKAQGYFTFRSPEGPDKGIDILAAPAPLGFSEPKVCVQVKSGDEPLDRPTLDQVIGVMQNVHASHGLIVSWGGFKSSVDKEVPTQFFRVRLWDQDDLINEVLEYYTELADDIKSEIPLRQVWTVNLTEE